MADPYRPDVNAAPAPQTAVPQGVVTQIPQAPDVVLDWSVRGGARGNRSSSEFGGSYGPRTSFTPGMQPYRPGMVAERDVATEATRDALGKTHISLSPSVYDPVLKEGDQLQPPPREVGFFEGMLGGLVEAFTGALPGWARDPLVGLAQGAGQVADIPGELLGHVPINEILGLEDVKGAFDMVPLTEEKARIIQTIKVDPTHADWYMSQYLRTHMGDYAAAEGLPQVFAGVIRPDATIWERALMMLGIPSQIVSREMAGQFDRAGQVLENASHPALVALRDRYLAGEFGAVGSQDALDRFNDEIVQAGFGWADDPFIGMVAEMVTDPVIFAGFGTGAAATAVRLGPIAAKAGHIARLATTSTDNVVQAAVKTAMDRLQSGALASKSVFDLKTVDGTFKFAKEVGNELKNTPEWRQIEGAAHDALTPVQRAFNTPGVVQAIEAAARVSEIANAPFGIFGKDGAAGLVLKKFTRNSSQGMFSGFGVDRVAGMYRKISDTTFLNESVGTALGYSQKSLLQGNLQRLTRFYRRGSDGKYTNPANLPDTLDSPEGAYAAMRETNNPALAQQMENHIRRVKRDVVPDVGDLKGQAARAEYDRQMVKARDEYALKLAQAANISVDEARKILNDATPDDLAFVHYAHWGRAILDLEVARKADAVGGQQTVKMTAQAAVTPVAGKAELDGAAAALDEYSIITRATLVGERMLHMKAARELLAQLEAAADDAAAAQIAETAISQYENLYQMLYEKTRITNDADLVRRTKVILNDGISNDRFVTVVDEANLPQNLRDLRNGFHSRGEAYEIGIAPARESRWAPILDEDGSLVGYNTWMDIRTTPEDVRNPTRFDVLRERVFTPIRGENVMQESRRQFIREGARRYGLSRAAGQTLWDSVRKAASDERTTMRSFGPDRFRAILDNASISATDRSRLGYRGLAELVARAMESDVAMLGLTSKLTGHMKTRTSRHGNYVGRLAEGIYPLIRFNLNPIFQLQEFIEPYFFNMLRGIKPGFKFTPEQVGFHSLMDEMNVAEHLADGFEAREFMMAGAWHARAAAGPNSPLAVAYDQMPMGKIGTPKMMNYYNLIRQQFGDNFHDALEKEYPGAWTRIQAHYNDWDVRHRNGQGNLSRAEISELYLKHKGLYDPDNDWVAIHHWDGAIPDEFGRIRGINKSYLAKQFGFDSGIELRAALTDPTNPLEEWGFRESLVEHGFSPEFAARAYAVAVGVTPEELYTSVAQHYTDPVAGQMAATLMESWHTIIANSKGISVEEYLARKFTGPTVWLNSNGRLPYNALPQRIFNDLADEWGWEQIPVDDDRVVRVTERARTLHVKTTHKERGTHMRRGKELQDHIKAGGKASEWVPKGKGNIEGGGAVAGIDMDISITPEQVRQRAERVLGRAQMAGAGDWYRFIPSMFTSFVENLTPETVMDYARVMNERMPSIAQKIDLTDLQVVREEVAARMLMAWSMTQSQTSPRDGMQFITKMMDRELRGRRPDQKGITKPDQEAQLVAMLRDFEENVNTKGAAAKLHDFTDSNLGLLQRTYMLADDRATYLDTMQPVAGDIWALRAAGFVDGDFLNYAARYYLRKNGHKGPISDKLTEATAIEVAGILGVDMKDLAEGQPTPHQYEFITHKYNEIAREWNANKYLMGEGEPREGRLWTASEAQAVDWLRIQKELGLDPDTQFGMVGKGMVEVQFEYRPSDHAPLREVFDLDLLTQEHQDYVTRTVTQDMVNIIEQETGVTVVRHQPGWGNNDGVISANTSWTLLGAPDAIDDALDTISLLTQSSDVVATTYPGRLEAYPISKVKSNRNWGIDFAPVGGADAKVLESLRVWLNQQVGKEGFVWEGSMTAMTPRTLGEAVRTIYSNIDNADQSMFEQAVPIPDSMMARLQDGSWIRDVYPDEANIGNVPVEVRRELFVTRRRKNDYATDEARARKRITDEKAEGPAADAIWGEEMGRRVQGDMTARGKDDVRGRVVGGHMATLRARADTAIQKADAEAWSIGRGRLGLRDGPGPRGGDEGVGGARAGGGTLTQYSPRGFRGAVAWDRGRTTAQSVATGATSGRRGTLFLKRGKADITTVIHETFHFMAEDLEPSAIKTLHNSFFASAEGQRYLSRGGSRPTGRNANNVLIREAEEWLAAQFEEYVATGLAPGGDPTINAVFNQYAQAWGQLNPNKVAGVNVDPGVQALFDQMTPDVHRGPAATFDVNEYRLLEAARIALQRAEEEAFRVHYYKRGRTLLERSINHPYLGMYPASYMWGKVLPELTRFLVRKPFGVDAPFAGLAMANHVYEAIQLELATDDGMMADLVEEFPALVHFLQLMVPGTPWDIPVNAPAWTRRLAQDAWAGKDPDFGRAITDTVTYAFGPGRAPKDILEWLGEVAGTGQRMGQMLTGEYIGPDERKAKETELADLRSRGLIPPEAPAPTRLQMEGVLQ